MSAEAHTTIGEGAGGPRGAAATPGVVRSPWLSRIGDWGQNTGGQWRDWVHHDMVVNLWESPKFWEIKGDGVNIRVCAHVHPIWTLRQCSVETHVHPGGFSLPDVYGDYNMPLRLHRLLRSLDSPTMWMWLEIRERWFQCGLAEPLKRAARKAWRWGAWPEVETPGESSGQG